MWPVHGVQKNFDSRQLGEFFLVTLMMFARTLSFCRRACFRLTKAGQRAKTRCTAGPGLIFKAGFIALVVICES